MSDLIPSASEAPSYMFIALENHDILLHYFEKALPELLYPLSVYYIVLQEVLGLPYQHIVSVLLHVLP